jgi:hypothetical protein
MLRGAGLPSRASLCLNCTTSRLGARAACNKSRSKQAADAHAAHLNDYRRSLTIDTRLPWELRRRQHYMRRRMFAWIEHRSPPWATAALRRGGCWAAGKLKAHG